MAAHVFNAWGIERVVFGPASFEQIAQEVDALGTRRVFLIVSSTLAAQPAFSADLERLLGGRIAGRQVGMPQHMPRPVIVEVAGAARSAGADLLLCIGGGSIVDSGKMIQLCLSEGIKHPDQLDRFVTYVQPDGSTVQPLIGSQMVRTVCVPTTLSGAEFTGRAGSLDPQRRLKQIFVHKELAPQVVVLDPALTVHTPRGLWLASGMRAVDHAIESFCSPDTNPYGEGLAMNGLRLLGEGLRQSGRDPSDLGARLKCQLGTWSAIGALQAGSTMGASHGIGHALGAFGVLHGHTSCVMLASVLRYNRRANAERQRVVAGLLGSPEQNAADLVEALVKELALPFRLRDVGIHRGQFADVAHAAMQDRWIHTNPRKINSAADVIEILEAAW